MDGCRATSAGSAEHMARGAGQATRHDTATQRSQPARQPALSLRVIARCRGRRIETIGRSFVLAWIRSSQASHE